VIQNSTPGYDFKTVDLNAFIWFQCRMIGSLFDHQTVPSMSGWLSKTARATKTAHCLVHATSQRTDNWKFNCATCAWPTGFSKSRSGSRIHNRHFWSSSCKEGIRSLLAVFVEVVIESGVRANGSRLKGFLFHQFIMSGRHYNPALRVHKLFAEGLERLLRKRFQSESIWNTKW